MSLRIATVLFAFGFGLPLAASAQDALLPLPDSTGWGVHVLTAAKDLQGGIWVGTYGQGMYRLAPGAKEWQAFRHDTTNPGSISMDFVQAIAFGPRGEIWYSTVGNGWGLSVDGGATWRNWA